MLIFAFAFRSTCSCTGTPRPRLLLSLFVSSAPLGGLCWPFPRPIGRTASLCCIRSWGFGRIRMRYPMCPVTFAVGTVRMLLATESSARTIPRIRLLSRHEDLAKEDRVLRVMRSESSMQFEQLGAGQRFDASPVTIPACTCQSSLTSMFSALGIRQQ